MGKLWLLFVVDSSAASSCLPLNDLSRVSSSVQFIFLKHLSDARLCAGATGPNMEETSQSVEKATQR